MAKSAFLILLASFSALVIASPVPKFPGMPYPAVAALFGPTHISGCNAVILAKGRLITTADCLTVIGGTAQPECFHVVMDHPDIAPFENGSALVEVAAKNIYSELADDAENRQGSDISNSLFDDLDEDELNILAKRAKAIESRVKLFNDYVPVKNFTIHPDMNGIFQNDVAILEIDESLPFSNDSIAEEFILGDLDAYYNRSVQVYGWGLVVNGMTRQKVYDVQTVEMKLLPPSYCSEVLGDVFSPDQHLCLIAATNETICMGFGGAPVVLDGKLIGLISYGSVECSARLPVVGVRLGRFADFLGLLDDEEDWFTTVSKSLEAAIYRAISVFSQ